MTNITCACGATFTKKHKWWHEKKSQQHLKWVEDTPFFPPKGSPLSIGVVHEVPTREEKQRMRIEKSIRWRKTQEK